jgi:hypothetical protein
MPREKQIYLSGLGMTLRTRSVRQAFGDLGHDLRPSEIGSAPDGFVTTYLTTYL